MSQAPLTVGVLALLMETGRMSAARFWSWYGQWWPVLLIGIGLVLLAEYFVDRNNPYAGRRSMSGFGFLILVSRASTGFRMSVRGWGCPSSSRTPPIPARYQLDG